MPPARVTPKDLVNMALKGTPQLALRVDLGEEEPRARQRGERGEDAPRARGAVARLVRDVVIVAGVRAAVALHFDTCGRACARARARASAPRRAAERRLPAVRQFFVRALVDVGVAWGAGRRGRAGADAREGGGAFRMPRAPAERRAIARGRVPSPPDDGPGFVAAPARARARKALRDIGAAADRHLGGTGVTPFGGSVRSMFRDRLLRVARRSTRRDRLLRVARRSTRRDRLLRVARRSMFRDRLLRVTRRSTFRDILSKRGPRRNGVRRRAATFARLFRSPCESMSSPNSWPTSVFAQYQGPWHRQWSFLSVASRHCARAARRPRGAREGGRDAARAPRGRRRPSTGSRAARGRGGGVPAGPRGRGAPRCPCSTRSCPSFATPEFCRGLFRTDRCRGPRRYYRQEETVLYRRRPPKPRRHTAARRREFP